MNLKDQFDSDLIQKNYHVGTVEGKGVAYRNEIAQCIAKYFNFSWERETMEDFPVVIIHSDYKLFVRTWCIEICDKNCSVSVRINYDRTWILLDLIDEITDRLRNLGVISALRLLRSSEPNE